MRPFSKSLSTSTHLTSRIITATTSTQRRPMATSTTYHPSRPRQFAPLKQGAANGEGEGLQRLRGIVFDVDGTLCLPQNYMFREMRSALGIDKSTDILEHVLSLSDETDGDSKPSARSRARHMIEEIERNAMSKQEPQPGLVELMKYLEERQIPKALCTRNFPAPVDHLIETFLGDLKTGFDMIITRDTTGIKPKPSPEGLWRIAENWGLAGGDGVSSKDDPLEVARRALGQGMIMVGDSIDDMAAGYRAGAATVLLANDDNDALSAHEYTDLSVRRLDDLIKVLEEGFVGKA